MYPEFDEKILHYERALKKMPIKLSFEQWKDLRSIGEALTIISCNTGCQ